MNSLQKTYILVEITHKEPLRKSVAKDLQGRLARAAYDYILARGGDCEDAKAKIVDEHGKYLSILKDDV